MKRSLRTNIPMIYTMGFFHSFMVVIPVFVPLLQGYGLSMTQVLQTQAMFALTVAVLEVPSGYFADLCGRRLAVLIGSLLNGIGFMSLLWADNFADFLVYEFILGIGISLISGADLALLYDTETCLQESGEGGGAGAGAGKSLSRLISIEAGASGIAGIVASLMLLWSMNTLIWLQAVSGFVPFLLALFLVEPPRQRVQQSHAANAQAVYELLLFGKPVVLWTTFAIIAFGLMAVYSFWIYQKYWELRGIPVAYFGYIWAALAIVVSISARYADLVEQWLGARRLLVLIAALPLLGLLGMALAQGWMGLMFCLSIQVARGLSLSLFYEALNRRVPGDFRATVNSLVSLAVRGVFIVTGPLLGYLLDTQGMGSTLFGLALVFAPLFMLIVAGLTRRINREQEATVVPIAAG